MSMSEATLELVFRARNLAEDAIDDLKDDLKGVASSAKDTASKFVGAFRGLGGAMSNAIGNAVETIASGGSVGQALTGAGVYMAGQLAETFAPLLASRLAGSALIGAIAAPLAGLGTAAGGLIASAIPIGMAALPALLIGAVIAAVAVLIADEGIRNKVIAFAGELVGKLLEFIGKGLAALGDLFVGLFSGAWKLVTDTLGPFVQSVVDFLFGIPGKLVELGVQIVGSIIQGLVSLPGRIADTIAQAFRDLRIDIGPFHISGAGVTIDLPKIDLPHFFAGGVQGFAGGLAVVGERGPELVRLPRGSDVIPNHEISRIGGAGGAPAVIQLVLDGKVLARVLDDRLYYRSQRAPSGS